MGLTAPLVTTRRAPMMRPMGPAILVASWGDGVFSVSERGWEQELAGCSVRALTPEGRGGALAVVDHHTLRQRASDGVWVTLATSDAPLACCVASQGHVYVGTEEARVLRLNEGQLVALHGFDSVEGRETWTAGRALVN